MSIDSDYILQVTGATAAEPIAVVQSLWSGYGEIVRYRLTGAPQSSVIVKQINPPTNSQHPRGWNSDIGHQRKLRSYQVEVAWYQQWAHRCLPSCRVPACLGVAQQGESTTLVLEDLNAAGFPLRKQQITPAELAACIEWLAQFHARFMGAEPQGLWPVGSYWHLATRPEEWAAMADGPLKEAAGLIDARLNQARFQTLIHGDAKLANFCFGDSGGPVAAVDFQYVGAGCGMKDLAYFVGSVLSEAECERQEAQFLTHYFQSLRGALAASQPTIDATALEAEWRALYPFAWADFYRFLQGWMPGHKKLNRYGNRLVSQLDL
ncbi:phosphotransferase [Halioxenophilus sp. WMMB6]|uniref:phosphotransferase n=1 Tax=Halioxenophilus sp. WMMB6 TaxID=3073815 RepID=UPI00295EAD66|nr:phosphotransferase [Halioxenophilus sp. WMMB6]